MVNLTPQEAAALWIIFSELLKPEDIAEACEAICERNNLPPDVIIKLADQWGSGMNKLSEYVQRGPVFAVIQGNA
jgi:hypothetical protein